MKSKIIFCFLLIYSICVFSQNANITSFQHTSFGIYTCSFPNYIQNKHIQDTILNFTSEALKKKFLVNKVIIPNEISFKIIGDFFTKPKLKISSNSNNSHDYNVAILSSIKQTSLTRRMYWNLEISVQQDGKSIYTNKKEHELECFSPKKINNCFPWWDEPEFVKLYFSLINELIDSNINLPQIITIGDSQDNIEKAIYQSIPNAKKVTLLTSGRFFSKSNFAVTLKDNDKFISNIVFQDGGSLSKGKFFSGLGETILTAISGIPGSYDYNTKETKRGKFEFSNGEIHKLIMTWDQTTSKNVLSESEIMNTLFLKPEYIKEFSQFQILIIKNDSLIGELTYFIEGEIYSIKGTLNNISLHVTYSPANGLIRVIENNETKLIVEMHNFNSETSGFFGGGRLNAVEEYDIPNTIKFKYPEHYNVFFEPNCNEMDVLNYMETVYCLFFGIGNQS